MLVDRLLTTIGERADRGTLLKRLGIASLGVTFGALGLSDPAHAYACCTLCHEPSSCIGCSCIWCWTCCNDGAQQQYVRCCECYGTTSCIGDCFGAQRSCYTILGNQCAAAPSH